MLRKTCAKAASSWPRPWQKLERPLIIVGRFNRAVALPREVGGWRAMPGAAFDARGADGDRGFALYGADGTRSEAERRPGASGGWTAAALFRLAGGPRPVIACPDGARVRAGEPAATRPSRPRSASPLTACGRSTVSSTSTSRPCTCCHGLPAMACRRAGDAERPTSPLPSQHRDRRASAAERREEDWRGCTRSSVTVWPCTSSSGRARVMTTMSQRTLDETRGARALAQRNDACFGVYASVRSPGRACVARRGSSARRGA